ncbi:MAG: ADP-glyceromanno-heptose 6-epimerase [Rickettsiales bacterium]|nr:ADP-glyceromanno-heptose 6-epimerase [Rickettsiales bacterium]
MIIVTGAAGFIGSNIVYDLNKKGFTDIIVVDDLTAGSKHLNLNSLSFVDYLDKDELIKELPNIKGKVKTIFHQGACSDTTEHNGKFMMETNYTYSKNLLLWACEHNVDFLYTSSAAVYGKGNDGFREDPICENPLNVYGFSKLAFDNYVRLLLKNKKLSNQILGLRYFNVFGYQENHKGKMASVPYHFYNQLIETNKMNLFEGSKNFLRDFIFIQDVLAVNYYFYLSKQSGIFNCGTGNARSFYDIAVHVKNFYEGSEINFIPFPDELKGRYQTFTQANIDQLRLLGCNHHFTSLEEGIDAYFDVLKESNGFLV